MDIPPLRRETERLRLVAGTKRLARAGRAKLAALLEADVTQSWPPAIMADATEQWAERLDAQPDLAGWLHWYVILKDEEGDEDVLIGSLGFNGLDEQTGTLLMGYCTLPAFQSSGYATEAALELLGWAFERPCVNRVAARTFPDNIASLKVLERIGMRQVHDQSDPYLDAPKEDAGAVLFEVTRELWEGAGG
jgi:[ribosomal protein S5]-alanine N-acetyltransferase